MESNHQKLLLKPAFGHQPLVLMSTPVSIILSITPPEVLWMGKAQVFSPTLCSTKLSPIIPTYAQYGLCMVMVLTMNQSKAIDPRISAKYQINDQTDLALAWGQHSAMQTPGIYFTSKMELIFPIKIYPASIQPMGTGPHPYAAP